MQMAVVVLPEVGWHMADRSARGCRCRPSLRPGRSQSHGLGVHAARRALRDAASLAAHLPPRSRARLASCLLRSDGSLVQVLRRLMW
jgi:hypothetical protein